MVQEYPFKCSVIFEVANLFDEVQGITRNDATVSIDIIDANTLATILTSQPVSYVSGSVGTYRYVTDRNLAVSVGQNILARITATLGSTSGSYWELPFIVVAQDG